MDRSSATFVPGQAPLPDLEMIQFFGGEGAPDMDTAAAAGVSSPVTELPYREQLEQSFGTDLSHVKAHMGGGASASCQALGAHAYATGNHVVFGSNSPGLFQVAHEVAHTFQQGGGLRKYAKAGHRGDGFEEQADAIASDVVAGRRVDLGGLASTGSAGPTIQRDAPRSFNPPADIAAGQLSADTEIPTLNTSALYDAMTSAVYYAEPANAGAYQSLFSRMSSLDFVRGNLRNMTNGGGVIEDLPPYQTAASDFSGRIQVRATISAVTFESADGVQISGGSTGGAGTGSSAGSTSSVGVGGTAGVKAGDAKAGGEGSAGVSATASDGTSHGSTGSWSGTGTTGMSATASVRFRFSVNFSVTISQDHEPRTWAAIVTLGTGYLAAGGRKSRTTTATGSGVLRIAAARCIPVP